MDVDTYETTKFILETIKPNLINGAIILFDELYNFEDGMLENIKH